MAATAFPAPAFGIRPFRSLGASADDVATTTTKKSRAKHRKRSHVDADADPDDSLDYGGSNGTARKLTTTPAGGDESPTEPKAAKPIAPQPCHLRTFLKHQNIRQLYTYGPVLGSGTFGTVYQATPMPSRSAMPSRLAALACGQATVPLAAPQVSACPQASEASREGMRAMKVIRTLNGGKKADELYVEPALVECYVSEVLSGHPNIVRLHECWRRADNSAFYLVMELAEHGTLGELIKEHVAVAAAAVGTSVKAPRRLRVEHIARSLLSALAYMHEQRVVHCDVKASNVLLCGGGGSGGGGDDDDAYEVKLCDFSVAHFLDESGDGTMTGMDDSPEDEMLCALFERPPEVALRPSLWRHQRPLFHALHLGAAVDVWSAGCVLAQCCLLRAPFWLPYDASVGPDSVAANNDLLLCMTQRLGWPTSMHWPGYALSVVQAVAGATPGLVAVQTTLPPPLLLHDELAACPSASPAIRELLLEMLCWDPASRVASRLAALACGQAETCGAASQHS